MLNKSWTPEVPATDFWQSTSLLLISFQLGNMLSHGRKVQDIEFKCVESFCLAFRSSQYQTARLENMPKWGSKGHSQQKIDIKPISCVTYDMSHIMWAIWDNISFINASFKIKIQAKSFEQAGNQRTKQIPGAGLGENFNAK